MCSGVGKTSRGPKALGNSKYYSKDERPAGDILKNEYHDADEYYPESSSWAKEANVTGKSIQWRCVDDRFVLVSVVWWVELVSLCQINSIIQPRVCVCNIPTLRPINHPYLKHHAI
jgi:hypothetical protein